MYWGLAVALATWYNGVKVLSWILGNMTRKIKEYFKIKRFQCLARHDL